MNFPFFLKQLSESPCDVSGAKTAPFWCAQCFKDTLMKAFPAPDLRREAAYSSANLCASRRML